MTSKRDRELARAKWERQQARREERATRESVIKRSVLAAVLVVTVGVVVLANQSTSTPTAQQSQNQTPIASATQSSSSVPSATASSPTTVCAPHGVLTSSPISFATPPTSAPAAKTLTLDTNCGNIVIALDPRAPKTSQIMTNLAKANYFNNTPCHRLTTQGIYVLQCGDPTGTGTGGPGFKFADENLPKVAANSTFTYTRGTIAMANSGPNTNGSQFFIVYDASPLGPNYSIWGHVTSGLDVVDKIANAGVQGGTGDGRPNADVAIIKATAN